MAQAVEYLLLVCYQNPTPCTVQSLICQIRGHRLTRTMVKDGRCRWASSFLLSPTLLGLGSGCLVCRWFTSCLCFLGLLAGFAAGLWASAAVVEVAAGTPLTRLLVLTTFAALILLVLLAVLHRSGTGWTPGATGHNTSGQPARGRD